MNAQEFLGLQEAYMKVYEEVDTRRAPRELLDRLNASREGYMAQDGPNKPAYDAKQRLLRKAQERKKKIKEETDLYDNILSHLLDEGYTEEESNQIMVLIIENQMNPPKVSPIGKPLSGQKPSTTISKPNPYRPGATIRATGPNMNKFPELQRFANQGTRITPTPKSSQGLSIPGGKLGAFVAGIQAYNTADATPKTAPKFPTTAKEVKTGETYYDPSTRVGSSQRFAQRQKVGPKIVGPKLSAAQDFDKAYATAKQKGGMGSIFSWKGKSYKVS